MSSFLRSRFSRFTFLWVWVGSLLRLWQISHAPFWYDEIFTSWLGQLPLPQLIEATRGDVHPPLWYLIAWGVERFSHAEWALRLPAALFSIGGLILFVHLARQMKFSESATLVGLAIMAMSPFQLFFAQEARMYALLQFSIMLGLLAMLQRRWWLLGICSVVMIYTHNYGLVYAALLYLMAFLREWGQPVLLNLEFKDLASLGWKDISDQANFKSIFISGALALVCYLPWALSMLGQFKSMDTWWQQSTTFGGFLDPLNVFLWGGAMVGLLQTLGQLVAFILLIFALWRAVQLRSKAALALAAGALAPMLFSWATELVTHPTYLYRSFIGSSPALYLLIGWALTERVDILKRRIVLGALAPLAAVAVICFYPTSWLKSGLAEDSVSVIQASLQPGDIVYHMNSGSLVGFWYAYPNDPEMWRYIEPHITGDVGTLSAQTLSAFGTQQVNIDDLPWKRAWLVWSAGPTMGIAEDQLVKKIVSDHAGGEIAAFHVFKSQYTGGIWLLKR